jgi:hypothetical protein
MSIVWFGLLMRRVSVEIGKVGAEMTAIRTQIEQDRSQRERDDDEKMRIINEVRNSVWVG